MELAKERTGLAPEARSIRTCLSDLARGCFNQRASHNVEAMRTTKQPVFFSQVQANCHATYQTRPFVLLLLLEKRKVALFSYSDGKSQNAQITMHNEFCRMIMQLCWFSGKFLKSCLAIMLLFRILMKLLNINLGA